MSPYPTLAQLQHWRVLSPVDVFLAQLVARRGENTSTESQLAMALASQWPQRGHVCLDLDRLDPEQLWEALEYPPSNASATLPNLEGWVEALKTSSGVGSPEDHTPFVLWQDRWLYLQRYWEYESTLADRLRDWLTDKRFLVPEEEAEGHSDDEGANEAQAKKITATLFNVESFDAEDRQQLAAVKAAFSPAFILTGGPGTGKTTTVVRLLALLLKLNPHLDIALAAPTGKAALRLQESITQSVESLACDPATKYKLPQTAQTLHRLLGYRRNKTTFRHHAENPLPYDLVVVDEASMMDLALMSKLVQAIPPHGRLLLVGDRNQLPSVEAGAVFGALCSHSSPIPQVELTRNYRFSQDTGIGALSDAVNHGDAALAETLLTENADPLCQRLPLPSPNHLARSLWEVLAEFLTGLAESREADEAFAHLETLRILCAHRTGPFGASTVNHHAHDLVARHFRLPRDQRWFPGRPILITENDYAVELFNGDTGVILPWKGRLSAFFRSADGGFRHLPPARLPAHESAYAMTVHKSQGSEFGHVHLILTDQPSRLLTRELLYTGITRARSQVAIWGPESSVRACIEHPQERSSGLATHFASWQDPPTGRPGS